MNTIKLISQLLLCMLLLSACSTVQEILRLPDSDSSEQASVDIPDDPAEDPDVPAQTPSATTPSQAGQIPRQAQILEMGSGRYTTSSATVDSRSQRTEDGEITFNFQNTDIREFLKAVFSDLMGVNYVIDPDVGGTITIETPTPLSEEDLLPIVEELLEMNNASLVISDGIYRILPAATAVAGNVIPTTEGNTDGVSVRMIPLRYVAAQEMQKILEPFVQNPADLRIDAKRNLVFITGTQNEVNRIQETIDIFDVDWMRGMSIGLYPLDYVDPETLKEELDSILSAIDKDESTDLGGLIRVVALERLNSILLISSTPAALREVEIWVHRLDQGGEYVGQRIYVYKTQNAKAVELAEILSSIFDRSDEDNTPDASLAPGTNPANTQREGTTNPRAAALAAAASNAAGTDPAAEGVSLSTGSQIEIIADDVRNALVILATPQDYKMVEAAIRQLDIVPLQVLIEARILEVTLRDDLSYGVEWFFKNSVEGDYTGTGTLDLGAAGIAALSPSFSYTIADSANQVRLALNTLQNESEVNVLSSPSLMVLDNQTATINVGDEIPVPSRQSISNLDPSAPTVNEIDFRQTGVTLTVTPRVNSGGLVTMEIKQEVSTAVDTTTSEIDAPTIQNRLIESVVAINSGETIVLGGLIQDTSSDSEGGIPGLYRIPLVGRLFFGASSTESTKTELLVLLTPRVVGDINDARNITDEYRNKLRRLIPITTTTTSSSS